MNLRPEALLFACAIAPSAAMIATLVSIELRQRRLRDVAAIAGAAAEFLIAGGLAIVLGQVNDANASEISVRLWTWFYLSTPHGLSIDFGLEATWVKAALISLVGLISTMILLRKSIQKESPLSDGMAQFVSCLNLAAVIFVFAPNLAQALLGWTAVSFLTAALIRLARHEAMLASASAGDDSSTRFDQKRRPGADQTENQWRQLLAGMADSLEMAINHRALRQITVQFPAWLMSQIELLESGSMTLQITTALLFASAILLTWLAINV
jgi:hypothetical protein